MNFKAWDIAGEFAQRFGPPGERRKRSVVHGYHMLHVEQTDRESGLTRPHREAVSDWQQREAGSVQVADDFHIAEDGGIAGVVNRQSSRQADNVSARFAAINHLVAILNPAGMDC